MQTSLLLAGKAANRLAEMKRTLGIEQRLLGIAVGIRL